MARPLFVSALSTHADSEAAEREVADALADRLDGRPADLACLFTSAHHTGRLEDLAARVREASGAEVLVGCTGESIVGGTREVEGAPAVSVWAASAPGMRARLFTPGVSRTASGEFAFSAPPEMDAGAGLLLIADPFTFPMLDYLELLNRDRPGVPAVGGMASAGQGPGQNVLFAGGKLLAGGAVGVVIEGSIEVASVVSQGCRPVGDPWVVTSCKENVILELGGQHAARVLVETLRNVSERDRELLQKQPFVGIAVDAAKSTFQRSDFLVRGIVGLDPKREALAIGATPRRGQTIQFLVRDADSAGEDLGQLMRTESAACGAGEPDEMGALLFSCNGRGSRMFATKDHDIGCVQAAFEAPIPTAGFFAMGEIGPVGGKNFLHGHTASVALFRPRGR